MSHIGPSPKNYGSADEETAPNGNGNPGEEGPTHSDSKLRPSMLNYSSFDFDKPGSKDDLNNTNGEDSSLIPSSKKATFADVPMSVNVQKKEGGGSGPRPNAWKSMRSLKTAHPDNFFKSIRALADIDDLESVAGSIFSDIRSEDTEEREAICDEAQIYLAHSSYQRAFPERSMALLVTLVFELPTLFLISGGSGQLCALIGRAKYTSLIALLPIISAISGNVGLQASTLTTRAISHGHVRVANYAGWLRKECMSAVYLGKFYHVCLCPKRNTYCTHSLLFYFPFCEINSSSGIVVGVVVSTMSYVMGGYSLPFAFSIFTAQFIGIMTAGFTGTLAPLLFTFIFKRDSGKWGGPLETAASTCHDI